MHIEYRIRPRNQQELQWAKLVAETAHTALSKLEHELDWHIEVVRKAGWKGVIGRDAEVYKHNDGTKEWYRYWINIRNYDQKPTFDDMAYVIRGLYRTYFKWHMDDLSLANVTKEELAAYTEARIQQFLDKNKSADPANIIKQARSRKFQTGFRREIAIDKTADLKFDELYTADHLAFKLKYN